MRVELDALSGRPNPTWELDRARELALRELVGRLEVAATQPPEPPALGYRGFVCRNEVSYRAFRGYVRTGDANLRDPACSVEWFLLDLLPDAFASLRPLVATELTDS